MKAKVAARGQVTIPQNLRQQLGIRSGTVLDFRIKNGQLIATKAEHLDPIDKIFGCLGQTVDTDSFMHELRGDQ